MDYAAIEKSLIKIRTIETHLTLFESDPLLTEDYEETMYQLQVQYGHEMGEILFEIYDEHCEDDRIHPFVDYIKGSGIMVEADDFPGVRACLKLKTMPLRFELEHPNKEYSETVWSMAS